MFLRRWNNRSTTPGHSPRRQGPRPRRLSLEVLEDRTLLTTWFVWQFGGSDQFGNGTPNAPFQSIQQAINQAAAVGDTIKVAGGVYTYDPFNDLVAQGFGVTGVIQVVN